MIVSANKKLLVSLLVISYLLAYLIGYLTPMHSDDFGYYNMGLSLLAHYKHYIGWSGRFIVDCLVAALLSINQHALIVGVNSLALVSLIYTVCTIPFYKEPYDYKIICRLYPVLFICYWMGNPDLGQTAFWIAGSANYLWPCLFSALFIKYFLRAVFSPGKAIYRYICLILAFVVGASNEVMSVTMISLLGLALIYSLYKKTANRHWIIYCFLLMLAGAALLLLAPGNRIRAANPLFHDWYALNLFERLSVHLLERLPQIYKTFSNFFWLYILVFCIFWRRVKCAEYSDRILIFAFLAANVIAAVSLFAAPEVASRTYLTMMYFLWLSLAFILKVGLQGKLTVSDKLFKVLTILLVVVFSMSYGMQLRAYYHAYLQSEIRIDLIKKGLAQGKKEVSIPDYYFLKFFGKNQGFDLFHNPQAMGAYYGLHVINVYPVQFDYSLTNKPCEHGLVDSALDKQVVCVWSYQRNFINPASRTLVLELTPQYGALVDARQSVFYLNLIDAATGKGYSSYVDAAHIGNRVFLSVSGDFSGLDYRKGHSAITIKAR